MPKLSLMLLPAVMLLILSAGAPVRAESMSCTSVNGRTVCTGSGAMSCQTADGGTVCTQGSSTSCTTVGDRTVCRSGSNSQTFEFGPPKEAGPRDEDEPEDDEQTAPRRQAPSPDARGRQRSWMEQDRHRQTLSIDRNGQRLRIRNGTLDLRID